MLIAYTLMACINTDAGLLHTPCIRLSFLCMDRHDMSRGFTTGLLLAVIALLAGVLLSREVLERAAHLTARAGAWLVMDNTYEHFVYEGLQHHCISAPHIIHLFSFSKVGSTLLCALHPCSSQCEHLQAAILLCPQRGQSGQLHSGWPGRGV